MSYDGSTKRKTSSAPCGISAYVEVLRQDPSHLIDTTNLSGIRDQINWHPTRGPPRKLLSQLEHHFSICEFYVVRGYIDAYDRGPSTFPCQYVYTKAKRENSFILNVLLRKMVVCIVASPQLSCQCLRCEQRYRFNPIVIKHRNVAVTRAH